MNIDAYLTNSKINEVNKNLTMQSQFQVRVTSEVQDIVNPIIELTAERGYYNYVKMNDRYYFIIKKEQLLDNRVRWYLHEDVLMTWFNKVNITGVIERSSENYDNDLKQQFPLHVNKLIERHNFSDIEDYLGYTLIAQSTYPYNTPT